MAIKRRKLDGTIEHVTITSKDEIIESETIERLVALVRELTDMLARVTGYNHEIAPCDSYDCYK